ncbi:uncharacterized protein LOC127864554 [Dreissena polymorpha]|uniref:Uncharacterized protein n=1 Tax=Dreissena polymorpha TaxID=45954 RepID=A0A9D4NMJ2_DREPO|nr:uncharacterized protein LOC127864554 [Dreissena polymorpha]KAH3897130.1 hypothetical protein DPMN_021315 [Dreissena polymorpha]
MNTVCVAIIACCLAFVAAEMCTTNSDCVATQCATGNTVICQHPNSTDGIKPNGGLCTCQAQGQCTTRADCLGTSVNLQCPDSQRHCYDNNCICDRFPIGKRAALN